MFLHSRKGSSMPVGCCQHWGRKGRCQQRSALVLSHPAALRKVMVCFCPTSSWHSDTTRANTLLWVLLWYQLGEKHAQCLLCLHKAWPVTPGWCHSRSRQGPALTFPLQKRLQILVQALLIVQHKCEDRCQLNLWRRSRRVSGSAAVRRQSSAGRAATTAGSSLPACACTRRCPHSQSRAFDCPDAPARTTAPTQHHPSRGPEYEGRSQSTPQKASPLLPAPEGEPRRDYLGLVVKLIPVPGALAAHGGVIQEQHGHLK